MRHDPCITKSFPLTLTGTTSFVQSFEKAKAHESNNGKTNTAKDGLYMNVHPCRVLSARNKTVGLRLYQKNEGFQ
jgi:hypothetical protein